MTTLAKAEFKPFQLTPLCEGRQSNSLSTLTSGTFQLTPLCEGRQTATTKTAEKTISTHSPLRGETGPQSFEGHHLYFNSLPSARGDQKTRNSRQLSLFQLTPLCEGRRSIQVRFTVNSKFQLTPLCEGRPF